MELKTLSADRVASLFKEAQEIRQPWESLWQDCYDYALPTRAMQNGTSRSWKQAYQNLFDATAADAVDQLAACLLSQVVPPWSPWVEIVAGPALSDDDKEKIAPALKNINRLIQDHLRHSNFTVELHQALLDMVTVGTACLWVGKQPPGGLSALQFQTLPLSRFYARGDDLQHIFMPFNWSVATVLDHFPGAILPPSLQNLKPDEMIQGVYAVIREDTSYRQCVITHPRNGDVHVLWDATLPHSPFIPFRWQKTAGEIYGRSPVMKALPDIKTANKVVELVLKNASIAVTGIWQADDDGVLNLANIKLVPGTIIPKAVGSNGLTPLKMPGNFDLSQVVLTDLRQRIKQALLADRLGLPTDRRMTATEILERSADMVRTLSAVYNRLQTELLVPLVERVIAILSERGDIPAIALDGRDFTVEFLSPLGRAQQQEDIQATLAWLTTVQQFGAAGLAGVNVPETLRWLGQKLGVPSHLLQISPTESISESIPVLINDLAALAAQQPQTQGTHA